MKNREGWNPLTKTLFTKLLIVLGIYTAILIFLFIISDIILSANIWYGTEILYPILNLISRNRFIFIMIPWIIGLFVIVLFYLNKALSYMDLLINASSDLVKQNEVPITLPEELHDVEKRLNEIKQTSIRNAKIAIENEQRKNDLIVYLAHDIKTPLTSIIGYLMLLNDEKDISAQTREKYINITLDKAFKLENLTNELFDVARYNSENIILDKEDFNINLMIEQITDEFYPLLKEKNKKIILSAEENINYYGDVTKLARVFNNIIKNAINYSYDDSDVSVMINSDDQDVSISISSFGDTLSPQDISKLFDKFFRADYSRTSSTGGSGLGLAIAKDIVESHQGEILVDSDTQTTFTIKLPKI